MKSILLPFSLLLLGSGAGIGTGLYFRGTTEDTPADTSADSSCTCPETNEISLTAAAPEDGPDTLVEGREYVRMNNQFVIPVVEEGAVAALVVLSLSIEVREGAREFVFGHEPKLRDAFLQVLFTHANIGGFDGAFTSATNMRIMRRALRNAAQEIAGPDVVNVLIMEIVRQDI